MELLLASLKEQGGPVKITYENVERHFPNHLFIKLLEEGLIGTHPDTSKRIYEEVRQSLAAGRSVTLAWENL